MKIRRPSIWSSHPGSGSFRARVVSGAPSDNDCGHRSTSNKGTKSRAGLRVGFCVESLMAVLLGVNFQPRGRIRAGPYLAGWAHLVLGAGRGRWPTLTHKVPWLWRIVSQEPKPGRQASHGPAARPLLQGQVFRGGQPGGDTLIFYLHSRSCVL